MAGEFPGIDSKLSAVVAFQVRVRPRQEGYTIGDKPDENTPGLKQLTDSIDRRGKGEKEEKASRRQSGRGLTRAKERGFGEDCGLAFAIDFSKVCRDHVEVHQLNNFVLVEVATYIPS